MLNQDQSKSIEKLQMDTMKTIYGFQGSYNDILQEQAIESLVERRQSLFDAYALKMSQSPKVSERWFPIKHFVHADLRCERIYTLEQPIIQ